MDQSRSVDGVKAFPLTKYVTFVGDEKSNNWTCNFGCRHEPYTGVYASIRRHLIGGAYPERTSVAVPPCDKVPENVREQMKKEDNEARVPLGKIRIRIKSPPPPPSDAKGVDHVLSPPPSGRNLVDCVVREIPRHENVSKAINGRQAWLGTSSDAPLQVPGSPEEAKPVINPLARLRLPRPQDYNLASAEVLQRGSSLATQVKSLLVSELMNTTDVNKMIDSANSSFTYLDMLCVDYIPFHKDVYTFISYHNDRNTAEGVKKGDAYRTKAEYEALEARVKEAQEAHLKAGMDLSEANEKLVPLRARYEEAKRVLMALEQKLAEGDALTAALEAENSGLTEVYENAKADANRMAPKYDEAMTVVMENERRWRSAILGIIRMKNLLETR